MDPIQLLKMCWIATIIGIVISCIFNKLLETRAYTAYALFEVIVSVCYTICCVLDGSLNI